MPELPEVAYACARLARHATGRRVSAVHLQDPSVLRTRLSTTAPVVDDPQALAARLEGGVVGEPVRRGKRMGLTVGEIPLLVHLGMTGRWVARSERPRFGRIGLSLDEGPTWWFDDARRFGCLAPVQGDLREAVEEGLGPDALGLEPGVLRERMSGRGAIKTRLMDQQRVAGIGNIQATEALWLAGIHPATGVDALGAAQWTALEAGLQQTLTDTLDDALAQDELVYLSTDKERNPFRCYGRVGEPCARCGEVLQTVKLGGRTSPCCPSCQA